jgi:hypothetical protein
MEVKVSMYLPVLSLADTFNTRGYQSRLAAEINIDIENLLAKCKAGNLIDKTNSDKVFYLAATLKIKYRHYRTFNNPVQFDQEKVDACLNKLLETIKDLSKK